MESIREVKLTFGTSRLWSPYRDLQAVINDTIYKKQHDLIPDFEAALKKHKPDFLSLLKNPGPNAASRAVVAGAAQKGLVVAGQTGGPQTLTQAHLEEALLISDMLQLDEIVALELLIAGEHQQRYFPGSLTRGLVAILLYYDGRRTLANCVRMLAQARPGRSWEVAGLHPDLTACLEQHSANLLEHGLLGHILSLIQDFDLAKEIEMLEKNRALGSFRYRKQVVDLIQECYQFLAETVFCWACQGGLEPKDTLRLLQFVSQGVAEGADGALEPVALCLLMALLYSLDLSPLQRAEQPPHYFSLLRHPHMLSQFHKKLGELQWCLPGLAPILHLAWGLALRLLSQCLPTTAENGDILEKDETMIDLAIKGNVFHHLKVLVVQSKGFRTEDFFVKQVHELVTNFIVLMPLKVKELRANGDEVAKIVLAHHNEGINPPVSLAHHLEDFFNLLTELYGKDTLELCQDYWCPLDAGANLDHKYQRQVALHKFVRLSSDYLPPPLFVPYVDMLASLANSPSASHHCYTFLKINGKSTPEHSTLVSWDHIMGSLNHYFSSLRLEAEQRLHRPSITAQEVARLKSVLRLLRMVVSKSESAGLALADHPAYSPLALLLGLLSCPVPPDLKASIFLALEAFAHLPSLNLNIFTGLEASKLLQQSSVHGSRPLGLFMELEELEARNEEFPMTRAFLSLLDTLISQPLPPSMSMEPYLVFVCNHVLVRFDSRSYSQAAEKWEVVRLCLSILAKLVAPGMPDRVVVSIMCQLLQGTAVLKILLYILHSGCQLLASYLPVPGHQKLEECLVLCLEVLHSGLLQQGYFLQALRESSMAVGVGVVSPLEDLMLMCNPVTGWADYLPTLLRLAGLGGRLALASLRLLAALAAKRIVAQHLADLCLSSQRENQEILYGIMEAMELDEVQDFSNTPEKDWSPDQQRTAIAQEALRLCLATLEPVPGLAHWLLGFSSPVARSVLQESPRTCLHTTLHAAHRPILAPLAFQLLYRLAAGAKTSAPTLRYLRGSDFFPVHLQRLPFTTSDGSSGREEERLLAQAWFLKTLALEIKLACEGQHKSHLQRLVGLLLDKHHSSENLLVTILGHLEKGVAIPSFPPCEYLAEKEVFARIRECEVSAGMVDEKLLRMHLEAEINPQRHLIAREVEAVMNYVKQINQAHRHLTARIAAFEAWRQVAEITLGLTPPDVLSHETRAIVVLDLAQELLDWLVREEVGELCSRGTGVVVTLLAVVYDQCRAEASSLLSLLRKLLDVLSHCVGGRERVKMHLYAAMLLLLLGPLKGVEALPSPEDKLGELVCKDACRGHTVTRMLAASLLDAAMNPAWLAFLMSKGYLDHLAMEASPVPLRDSLCSLFAKVAQCGPKAVLAANILPRLPDCSPACLYLALSTANTLRPAHRQLLSQLCVYLTTQVEALSAALRSPSPHLALVSCLLAYVASIDVVESLEQPSQVKLLRQHQADLLATPEKLEPAVIANILHSLCPSGTKLASQIPKPEVLVQLLYHVQNLMHKAASSEQGVSATTLECVQAPADTTLLYYILEKCTFLICHLLEQRSSFWPELQPREISSLFPESFFTRYNIVEQALKRKETNPFLETMLRRIKKVVQKA